MTQYEALCNHQDSAATKNFLWFVYEELRYEEHWTELLVCSKDSFAEHHPSHQICALKILLYP